ATPAIEGTKKGWNGWAASSTRRDSIWKQSTTNFGEGGQERLDRVRAMPRKKKKPAARKPVPMRWEFGAEIPTHDFLEEGPLDDPWNLQQAVENFVSWVEEGQFL